MLTNSFSGTGEKNVGRSEEKKHNGAEAGGNLWDALVMSSGEAIIKDL